MSRHFDADLPKKNWQMFTAEIEVIKYIVFVTWAKQKIK